MDLEVLAAIHGGLGGLGSTAFRARTGRSKGRTRAAAELATKLWEILRIDPACPAVYLQQGAWRLEAGDVAGAERVFAFGEAASGDPALTLRRVDCLRLLGDEAGARALLAGLVARDADDVRGHWRLAAMELDAGDPLAARQRLAGFLAAHPVGDAEALRRALPAALLLLECARALGRAPEVPAIGGGAGVDAEVLAAAAATRDRGARLAEALRGAPYHPWGNYALAAERRAEGDDEAARGCLSVAIHEETALAWRVRGDPRFAGIGGIAGPAARHGWLMEVQPRARLGQAYLPLRTGAEEEIQRAWWPLPVAVRAYVQVVDGAADGVVGPHLRVVAAAAADVHAGLRALAPFVTGGRVVLGEHGGGWVDELRFVDGVLRVRREACSEPPPEVLARRTEADPKDRSLRALAAEAGVAAARVLVDARSRDEEAERVLARALEWAPEHAEGWRLRGQVAQRRGDAAGARAAYERAIALGTKSAEPRVALAGLLRAAGEPGRAAELLRAASELADRPTDVFHQLGLTLQAQKRWDEAIAAYDRSIASRPQRSSGSKLNKGNVYAALERWAEALACYDAAIAEEPTMAYAWGGRGQALRNLGRGEEAEVALRRAIELAPDLFHPWVELAQLHFADSEEAVRLCDEALRRKPDCQYAWSTKGSALNNLRRFAEAHACYDRAAAIDAGYWHPHYCRACSYALQGERDAAIAAVAEALRIDPRRKAMLRAEADLASLREDPRFVALVGR